MKCSDEIYNKRYNESRDIDIYELIRRDKEMFLEENNKFSSLYIMFSCMEKFMNNKYNDKYDFVNINNSLEVVISFLRDYNIEYYYKFLEYLTNKKINFISYSELPRELEKLIDYINSVVPKNYLFTTKSLEEFSDVIFDYLYDFPVYKYLILLGFDVYELICDCIFKSDYEGYKKDTIDIFMNKGANSFATDKEIFICYDNSIKDAFYILHEFIHFDYFSSYDCNVSYGEKNVSDRKYNFFLNEIPSIMMEVELYDYLLKNYDYDVSFYLPYRIGLKIDDIRGMYLPIIGMGNIDNNYIEVIRDFINSSEKNSLMYMLTCEYDNYDNRYLSYIFGIIVGLYSIRLCKDDRVSIFNYIKDRLGSDDSYFSVFDNIGLDICNYDNIVNILNFNVNKDSLVKKR